MTTISQFNSTPCPQIDPLDVNAYFKLELDEVNSNLLKLDTSWGCTVADLSPLVKANETITHLFITPEGSLQFNREDYGREGAENGGVDCITGKELSRIISMQYLKDVSQTQPISDGCVYMYDGNSNLFKPHDLLAFETTTTQKLSALDSQVANLTGIVNTLQSTVSLLTKRVANNETNIAANKANIATLQSQVATLQSQMSSVLSRLSAIEAQLTRPAGVPTNTRLVWGNINYISDYTNTGSTATGLYSHNPANKVTNDAYDA